MVLSWLSGLVWISRTVESVHGGGAVGSLAVGNCEGWRGVWRTPLAHAVACRTWDEFGEAGVLFEGFIVAFGCGAA
jgi:hypothetical protein